jgi:hypothetical protein
MEKSRVQERERERGEWLSERKEDVMRDESEGMRRRKVPPRRRDQSRRTDLKGEEAEGEDRSRRERRRDRGDVG